MGCGTGNEKDSFLKWSMLFGVGSDDSWGALPHLEYSLSQQGYSYWFGLKSVGKKNELMKMSKMRF